MLSVVASATLVFGLIEGRTYGWWTPSSTPLTIGDWSWSRGISPIPIAFLVAVVAGVAFVRWSLRRQRSGRSALIALDLFRIGSFRNGSIAALIVSLGEFGIILSLPLWLQNVLGYSALQTGFVLLALAIGSFVASGFAATVGQRIGALPIVRMGIGAEIVGVAAIGFVISATTAWWAIVPCLFVYGFGVGLATAQLTGVVLQDVPVQRSGEASGAQSTARQIGSALGIAVLGTVLFTSTGTVLEHRLQDAGAPAAAASKVADAVVQSSGGAIGSLTGDTRDAAAVAFSDGTRAAAFSAAGFLVIGLGATLRLRAPRATTKRLSRTRTRSRRPATDPAPAYDRRMHTRLLQVMPWPESDAPEVQAVVHFSRSWHTGTMAHTGRRLVRVPNTPRWSHGGGLFGIPPATRPSRCSHSGRSLTSPTSSRMKPKDDSSPFTWRFTAIESRPDCNGPRQTNSITQSVRRQERHASCAVLPTHPARAHHHPPDARVRGGHGRSGLS